MLIPCFSQRLNAVMSTLTHLTWEQGPNSPALGMQETILSERLLLASIYVYETRYQLLWLEAERKHNLFLPVSPLFCWSV